MEYKLSRLQRIAGILDKIVYKITHYERLKNCERIEEFNDALVIQKTSNTSPYTHVQKKGLDISPALRKLTMKEAYVALRPGVVVELLNPFGEWFDYTMKDTYPDKQNLSMLYINGRLKFKEDE